MASRPYYDVFLSFRGPDIREAFKSLLHAALERVGLSTFMDDVDISSEENADLRMREGIRYSKIAIIIFSKTYAFSTCCLDELVLILDRRRTSAYLVLPMCYYGVELDDIRYQRKGYGEALSKHQSTHGQRVEQWRKALAEVGLLRSKIVMGNLDKFLNETAKEVGELLSTRVNSLYSPRSVNPQSRPSLLASCHFFSFEEIYAATNQFDSRQILGQGGEARVYFAEIYIGSEKTPVAVKQFRENSEDFEGEIHTVSKIQHPNLVSLIGYCDDFGYDILVYEYMAKGCLSDYVKKKSELSLSWLQRLNICLGAARGLQHLHIETDENPKGIIHRDVKPGNILVGENWVGKLSDFGMFKLSNAGQDKSLMTTNLKGTSGYYAPEYIMNRRITRKIDVYAFGVVLFEVLCRKSPWDREDESYSDTEDEDLGVWAQQNVDAQIQGEISGDCLQVYTDIIRRSLQVNPGRRPTMDGVVVDLQKALECQDSEKPSKAT